MEVPKRTVTAVPSTDFIFIPDSRARRNGHRPYVLFLTASNLMGFGHDLLVKIAGLYSYGYNSGMNILIRSETFSAWLEKLRDSVAKARIVARLIAVECGNFGQIRTLDEGVCEMKIDVGPGYRVYYMRKDGAVYLLLAGGDKSTQKSDIARAIRMAREARIEAALEKDKESTS